MSKMVPVNHAGMSDVQNVYGGNIEDGGISISEYYRGGTYVPLNQLSSVHSTGPIPLLSGGIGQTISIGMFRGTRKAFQWVFNITENRFTSFNLYNELIAVGWGGDIPVEVTINVFPGVYVVSQSTSIPSLDASGPFDAASKLVLNNNGFIYGRGGDGGKGGRLLPEILPEDGQDGGTAVHLTLDTTIFNNGSIAGGGGGGAGGPQVCMFKDETNQNGETFNWRNNAVIIRGISGGGGAPFGRHGDHSPTGAGGFSDFGNPPFAITPGYEIIRIEPMSLSTHASISTPGRESIAQPSFLYGTLDGKIATSGAGGFPGENGGSGHSSGDIYSPTVIQQHGNPGNAGIAIVNPNLVTWGKYGIVKGRMTAFANFGKFLNGVGFAPSTNLQSVSRVQKLRASSVQQIISNFPNVHPSDGWSSALGNIFYGYNSKTNTVDTKHQVANRLYYNYPLTTVIDGQNKMQAHFMTEYGTVNFVDYYLPYLNSGPSSVGTNFYVIKYICVCYSDEPKNVRLYGIVDDGISYVHVNGVTKLTAGTGLFLNKSTPSYTGSFDIPAGHSIIEIGVKDNNGGSGSIQGNCHMINLQVQSLPYNQILVNADEWYVKEIINL